jgi:sterol desaturase/sphingolipid hydroxylase (fatty acid hydroxylase superfamily)
MVLRQILSIGIALAILGTGFWIVQRRWPAQPGLRRTPREVGTDLCYWLLAPLVTKPLARVAVMVAVVPVLWLMGRTLDRGELMRGFGPIATLAPWLQAAIIVVLGDFIGYWMHRAFHRGRLWPFHAVHHGVRELTWFSAVRVHPVNDALTRMAQAIPFVALGFSPAVVGVYLPFLTLHALLLHANVRWNFGPLRHVFSSPTFHRWHHSDDPRARDKNFAGLLPVWDWCFGTLYLPRGERPASFGLQGQVVPAGWLTQMAWPFRHKARVASAG